MNGKKKRYTVMIRENSHFMDDEGEYKHGDFNSCEEAVAACKKIVDEYLEEYGGTAKDLWKAYTMYGYDPYIISDDEKCSFSCWNYAKKRCEELESK